MQATLHKKSGGMHHVKKSGGMKHMKKAGGMATTKKTGGMKKIGGMNMTKKSGGKCGMPLATSGGMHHKTVKGGMYHSKKHGGTRKVIGGGDVVSINGNTYDITVDGNSVTVTKMGTDETIVPPTEYEDGGPLKPQDLDTDNKIAQLNINPLTEPSNEDGNKDQEGNELLDSIATQDQPIDIDNRDDEEEEEKEEEEKEEDMFKEVGDSESAAEELIKEDSSIWNKDMQDMLDELNKKSDEQTDDDKAAIELLEEQKKGYEMDGGKKKGGKTLKKGGKPVKKHGGSVKKAFNKLFKRGGNKALPKKGGKK